MHSSLKLVIYDYCGYYVTIMVTLCFLPHGSTPKRDGEFVLKLVHCVV